MSVLKIFTFPDPVLQKKAEPIKKFDAKLKSLADDMIETMLNANGIGLAAPQVGVSQRLIVVEIPGDEEEGIPAERYVVCNPLITKKKGHAKIEEGCLSLPDFFVEVDRAKEITLEGNNLDGSAFKVEADDLLSICFQHELDHLNGTLLTNYVDVDEREEYRKAMKMKKQAKDKPKI